MSDPVDTHCEACGGPCRDEDLPDASLVSNPDGPWPRWKRRSGWSKWTDDNPRRKADDRHQEMGRDE